MATNNNDRALMLVDATSIGMTREELVRWKAFYAKEAPDEDFLKFIEQCVVYGTDPRRKRCFLIPRYDAILKRKVYSYQIALSGLISLAQRTGEFEGFTSVEFCGVDMQWHDVWPKRPVPGQEDTYPYACRVGVYRKGFRVPLMIVRYFHEMAYRMDREKKVPVLNSEFWQTMPLLMSAKCTKSQCVREAFEDTAGGIYIPEEMHTSTAEMEYMNSLMQEDDRIPSTTTTSHVVDSSSAPPQTSSSNSSATEQQLVSIRKLCEHLGKPVPENVASLNHQSAKQLIEQLTAEYRETRKSNKAQAQSVQSQSIDDIPTPSQLRATFDDLKPKDAKGNVMTWEAILSTAFKQPIADGKVTLENLVKVGDELPPNYCAHLSRFVETIKASRAKQQQKAS